MGFSKLEASLEAISKELNKVEGRREKVLKESRDVISLLARAIVSIHLNSLQEARSSLDVARGLLAELRKVGAQDLHNYILQPEAEYVEASALYAIAMKMPVPSYRELSVSGASYLLGLLDAIGEVKRLVYDRIREGRGEEASELFDMMERVYILLSPFSIYDHVARGVKRRLDVARALVESVRAAVTEEVRRSELMRAIEGLPYRRGRG